MIWKLLEILRSQIKLTWLATLEQFENPRIQAGFAAFVT